MPASANERLAAVGIALDRACQLLQSPTPEHLDESTAILQTAISELVVGTQPAPTLLTPGSPEQAAIRKQARFLKSSIRRARALLESAAAFHANWFRCLSARCAGYSPQGQPATLDRHSRLIARG